MGNKQFEVKIYVEKLANLVHNEQNPRYIKTKKHKELVKSLKDFPEMKDIREIVVDQNLLILAGDKRVYALEELDYTDVRVKQVIGLSEAKKREFIAKDNVHSGEWDRDVIANSWDTDLLNEWGVPEFKLDGEDKKNVNFNAKKDVTCPNCGHEFPISESANQE